MENSSENISTINSPRINTLADVGVIPITGGGGGGYTAQQQNFPFYQVTITPNTAVGVGVGMQTAEYRLNNNTTLYSQDVSIPQLDAMRGVIENMQKEIAALRKKLDTTAPTPEDEHRKLPVQP
jgi:hypothetical protein